MTELQAAIDEVIRSFEAEGQRKQRPWQINAYSSFRNEVASYSDHSLHLLDGVLELAFVAFKPSQISRLILCTEPAYRQRGRRHPLADIGADKIKPHQVGEWDFDSNASGDLLRQRWDRDEQDQVTEALLYIAKHETEHALVHEIVRAATDVEICEEHWEWNTWNPAPKYIPPAQLRAILGVYYVPEYDMLVGDSFCNVDQIDSEDIQRFFDNNADEDGSIAGYGTVYYRDDSFC